jgi:hypothetical protein
MTKCLELTFIFDPSRFSSYTFAQHYVSSHIVCCASNHQNNIEMAQGHISLSGSSWIIDNGCTNHMMGEKKMFTSYVKNNDSQDTIIFRDGN